MGGDWTRAMVADRLDLAADVMHSLPPVGPQGYVSAWPEYVSSFADQVEQEPRMKKPLPSPRMITQADEAMLWLRWLERTSARSCGRGPTANRGSGSHGVTASAGRPRIGGTSTGWQSSSGGSMAVRCRASGRCSLSSGRRLDCVRGACNRSPDLSH